MRRLSTVRARLDRGDDPGDLTNKWFIAFTFFTQPKGPRRSVVALLDGSYGVEHAISSLDEARLGLHPDVKPPTSSNNLAMGGPDSKLTTNFATPFAELTAQWFRVPAVQWNPLIEKFPLSLHSEALTAEAFLAKELSLPGKSLTLIEIYIRQFPPTGAILANNLDPRKHLHHWMVVLRFRLDLSSIDKDYYVYVLLDGTILRTVVQSPLPSETGIIVDP